MFKYVIFSCYEQRLPCSTVLTMPSDNGFKVLSQTTNMLGENVCGKYCLFPYFSF